MAVFDPMAFAPVKVARQWSIEGGRLNKPHGLDVKEIDTTDGTVPSVKLDKHGDWLLTTLRGKAEKAALRRSSLFRTFASMLQEDSPWTPERGPDSSPSSAVADTPSPAVAEFERCDPMSQFQEISRDFSTPKKARKGPYKSKRGQNNMQIVTIPA